MTTTAQESTSAGRLSTISPDDAQWQRQLPPVATRFFFVSGSGTDPMRINAAEPCVAADCGLRLSTCSGRPSCGCDWCIMEAECHPIRFGQPPEQMQSSAQTLRGRPLSSASCSFDHVIFVDPLAVCLPLIAVGKVNSHLVAPQSSCSSSSDLLNNSKKLAAAGHFLLSSCSYIAWQCGPRGGRWKKLPNDRPPSPVMHQKPTFNSPLAHPLSLHPSTCSSSSASSPLASFIRILQIFSQDPFVISIHRLFVKCFLPACLPARLPSINVVLGVCSTINGLGGDRFFLNKNQVPPDSSGPVPTQLKSYSPHLKASLDSHTTPETPRRALAPRINRPTSRRIE